MSNVVYIREHRFKTFIDNNREKIYANTPTVCSISEDDEWAAETEWDDLFRELSAKKKK